uniref:OPA3-like protein CG13603 n=1 Tax=Steinernema glaseri TaxID=37863 RepID=A0A1I7YMJ5_9BILA
MAGDNLGGRGFPITTLFYYFVRMLSQPASEALVGYGKNHPWFSSRVLIPFGKKLHNLNQRVIKTRAGFRKLPKEPPPVTEAAAIEQATDLIHQVVMFMYSLGVVTLYYEYKNWKSASHATAEDVKLVKESLDGKHDLLKEEMEKIKELMEKLKEKKQLLEGSIPQEK